MKKIYVLALLALAVACKSNTPKDEKQAGTPQDGRFNAWKGRFINALWGVYPTWAQSQGYHAADSILAVPDEAHRQLELKFLNAQLDTLKGFNIKDLDTGNQTDHVLLANQLNSLKWYLTEFKEYEWNPSQFNVADGFSLLLTETYAPLDERLRRFAKKQKQVPAYYAAARAAMKTPTQPHLELAIRQNQGTLDIFGDMLNKALAQSGLPTAEKTAIQVDAGNAMSAIKDYISFLETYKNTPGQTYRDWRIGQDLYGHKFAYDLQSRYNPAQLYQKAFERKKELHDTMAALAGKLWPKYFGSKAMPNDRLALIRKVLDTLAATHADKNTFQAAVEKQLPELVAFIKQKDLLYIDPSKPLVVRRTPDYMAGFSIASINAPGPYDKGGNTYYNVEPLDAMPAEKVQSHLREYNRYTMQILNIHEAIPGHYTQLVYSNRSPSLVKSLFGSGSMVEGWAVYTERMMLEQGYGDQSPELWMMYYKWHLRTVCNTLLDISLQTRNMSQEEAMNLLQREGFQETQEAEGKWRRAQLSQVQLCSYFSGYSEIYDLREELRKDLGDRFSLKDFHETFLSYGSAPVGLIRVLMLGKYGIRSQEQ